MKTLEQVLTPYIVENLMLLKQRDELLAVCKLAVKDLDVLCIGLDGLFRTHENTLNILRKLKAVIASVEGNHKN